MNELMEELRFRDSSMESSFKYLRESFADETRKDNILAFAKKERFQLCIATLLENYQHLSSSHQLYIPRHNFETVKEALPERDPSNARITVYVNPSCADRAEEIERNGMQVRVMNRESFEERRFALLGAFSEWIEGEKNAFIKAWDYKKRFYHMVVEVASEKYCCYPYINKTDMRKLQDLFNTFFEKSVPLREWQKNKAITKQNIPFPNNAEHGRGARED